jgi:cytoskeletal protein CcmA (bactofilin family)
MSNVSDRAPRPAAQEPRLWEIEQAAGPPTTVLPPRPERVAAVQERVVPEARKAPEATRAPAEAKAPSSVFGATLRFKGELHADEDFTLQGRIEGSIHHTQHLTIGTDGVVKGDSRARSITVDGTVEGDLYALEWINIRPTAHVLGNLLAPRVAIADGANFNGKIDMASAARAVRSIVDRQPAMLEEPEVDRFLTQPGQGTA